MFFHFQIEINNPGSFAERHAILHDLENPHAQWNLQDHQLPDFDPDFSTLWLTDDSTLVDFVNDGSATGGLGLLISKRAKTVIENLNLPPHRFYPLEVLHRERKIPGEYFWLQMVSVPYDQWIYFPASEFQLRSHFEMDPDVPGENVQPKNSREFQELIDSLGDRDKELLFSKIVLNERYKELNYDIFYLERIGTRSRLPIITQRVKELFEKNVLVGYRLMQASIELR